MKMERLTARTEAGRAYLVNVKPDEQEVDSPHRNTLQCILDCFERLAQYEDAEQEREKGCEFCAEGEDLAYGQDSMQRTGRIYLDGNLLTADLYSESMAVAVCYCPMCGKRLEVKHEAD